MNVYYLKQKNWRFLDFNTCNLQTVNLQTFFFRSVNKNWEEKSKCLIASKQSDLQILENNSQVDIRKWNYSISNTCTSSARKPLRRILMNDRPLASNFPRGPFPSVYNFDLRPFLSVLCMSGYEEEYIIVKKYFFVNKSHERNARTNLHEKL